MKRISSIDSNKPQIILFSQFDDLINLFSSAEIKDLKKGLGDQKSFFKISVFEPTKLLVWVDEEKSMEQIRKLGAEVAAYLTTEKLDQIQINRLGNTTQDFQFLEGLLLKRYAFEKYKTEKQTKTFKVKLVENQWDVIDLLELENEIEAVNWTRDLVNEPVNQLNTERFIKEALKLSKLGAKVEVLRKSQIEALNMGGVLGVNKGSLEEPAFISIEWKPKKLKNDAPIVLVGKGILFDTGGINIKTGDFMTDMKADMGGAATVLGILKASITNNLPIHLVGLLPVTENRISGKELVPGDVITMHNGKTVEVLNTDAEGRLVLADALSFASKYKPSLVIDFATLTGSAARALGSYGAPIMGTDESSIQELIEAGQEVYERLVEFPMWEEYAESLKSDIADLNNLGAGPGQLICAGHFLKNFVESPWIHLDIAGPAFVSKSTGYIPKGGTGFGVRLVYQYLKNKFA